MENQDYSARLTALNEIINTGHRRLGELEAAKGALGPQRQTIVALCQKLKVNPDRVSVQAAIDQAETELNTIISSVDHDLRQLSL